MEGFDPGSVIANSMSMNGLMPPRAYSAMTLPLDMPDHLSNLDAHAYAGSEDHSSFDPLQYHSSPQLKRFSSSYDDPFSDVVSAFDTHLSHTEVQDAESPSIDRNNKLLGFSEPSFEHVLLDYTSRQTTASLAAQLHGMFFLAESPWAAAGDHIAPPPTELTCYRRNLFQVTGSITLPRMLRYILTVEGKQVPILSQELVISATESTEGNPVKLISVPWKTPSTSNGPVVDDKIEREPPPILLDLLNVQDVDSDFANFPFQWKRLQFRNATANNGRRKELQQHFVVRLKVMAALATGDKVSICEVRSSAIIVRGRSPRNFQSRKDTPLNGGGSHARKTSHMPGMSGTPTGDSDPKRPRIEPTSNPHPDLLKTEPYPPPPMSIQSFFDPNDLHMPPDFFDGLLNDNLHHGGGAMTALPHDQMSFDPTRAYPASSPDFSRFTQPMAPMSAPINLSLEEDDTPRRSTSRTESMAISRRALPGPRPPSFSLHTMNSPDESADLLYEYFPLGLDDWMPPVDAVYRPHVVHHTNLPSLPRDQSSGQRAGRSKRYFSGDMG